MGLTPADICQYQKEKEKKKSSPHLQDPSLPSGWYNLNVQHHVIHRPHEEIPRGRPGKSTRRNPFIAMSTRCLALFLGQQLGPSRAQKSSFGPPSPALPVSVFLSTLPTGKAFGSSARTDPRAILLVPLCPFHSRDRRGHCEPQLFSELSSGREAKPKARKSFMTLRVLVLFQRDRSSVQG